MATGCRHCASTCSLSRGPFSWGNSRLTLHTFSGPYSPLELPAAARSRARVTRSAAAQRSSRAAAPRLQLAMAASFSSTDVRLDAPEPLRLQP